MAKIDIVYHQLLRGILEGGYVYKDEKRDIMCRQISSAQLEFNLSEEFPILTTKKIYFKAIVAELLWFLRGENNIENLVKEDVNIWNKDAYRYYFNRVEESPKNSIYSFTDFLVAVKEGDLESDNPYGYRFGDIGRNYGVQWRDWTSHGDAQYDELVPLMSFDQISNLITNLMDNPMSRRHIVTAWNPAELDETALPPCHWAFEIIPRPLMQYQRVDLYNKSHENQIEWKPGDEENEKILNEAGITKYGFVLKWHQRSVDVFLGLPFNIASYALLAKIIEQLTGYKALSLIADLSNVHIYQPHAEAVEKQLKNSPTQYYSPSLIISDKAKTAFEVSKDINHVSIDTVFKDLEINDFTLTKYKSYPTIKAEMFEPKK